MITLQDHLKKASQAQKDKYPKKKFQEWASKGRAFLKNMTPEEKKEYFRKIRNGEKVKLNS